MIRRIAIIALMLAGTAFSSAAAGSEVVLVMPLRTVGVDENSAVTARDILAQELQARGWRLLSIRFLETPLPRGENACDYAECAREWGETLGADRVVFGSLNRLGEKLIVRVASIRPGSLDVEYVDRFSAAGEEELDRIMIRMAEGISAGRPNSDLATIDSVVRDETREPLRQATRKGMSFRGGVLFPSGRAYGDADRLTSIKLVYKYEARDFMIQMTPIAGLAWGDGTFEWTILDLFAARVFGVGNMTGYFGGGVGLAALDVRKKLAPDENRPYTTTTSQAATTMTFDVGVGIIAMRTYDMNVVVELRYHVVAEKFDRLGGNGAHGLTLSFGTGH